MPMDCMQHVQMLSAAHMRLHAEPLPYHNGRGCGVLELVELHTVAMMVLGNANSIMYSCQSCVRLVIAVL